MINFDLFSSSASSTWSALGWTVTHFFWQGALIGLIRPLSWTRCHDTSPLRATSSPHA